MFQHAGLWLCLECVHLYLILKQGQTEFTSTGSLVADH